MEKPSFEGKEPVSPNGGTTGDVAASPADNAPIATRDAPVGGQAVLEGVMMRGVSHWAVAVRKPDGEIATEVFDFTSKTKKRKLYRMPIIRGVVALVESLAIGMKALGISANYQLEDEDEKIGKGTWAGTVALSLMFSVGLFFLLPLGLTNLFANDVDNSFGFVLIEKAVRLAIFLFYLWAVSQLKDLRRVFEYHGAEHKTIFNYESGKPLEPATAQGFSRFHPRCGTSFLLIVMIVSIFVFVPLGRPDWYILYPSRVIGIPLVAGLAFEVIKWFGRKRNSRVAQGLMWPGLQLQKLTTREPDEEQLEVAIVALQAVLDREDPMNATEEDRVGMEVVA